MALTAAALLNSSTNFGPANGIWDSFHSSSSVILLPSITLCPAINLKVISFLPIKVMGFWLFIVTHCRFGLEFHYCLIIDFSKDLSYWEKEIRVPSFLPLKCYHDLGWSDGFRCRFQASWLEPYFRRHVDILNISIHRGNHSLRVLTSLCFYDWIDTTLAHDYAVNFLDVLLVSLNWFLEANNENWIRRKYES